MKTGKRIILFDGVCNLCNGLVRFIVKNDRSGSLMFAPLQSAAGKEILQTLPPDEISNDTVVYSRNGVTYFKSDAVLEILRDMGGPWKALRLFRFIPRILRDALYDVVARYRYRIFGKRDHCMVPGPGDKDRFVL